MQQLVDFTKLENGNLRISIIGSEERTEIEEISANGECIRAQFAEIIGYQLGQEWEFIPPEDITALTDSPLLSDSAYYNDHGRLERIEKVWWYPEYQVYSEVEQLLEHGYIDFTLGEDV